MLAVPIWPDLSCADAGKANCTVKAPVAWFARPSISLIVAVTVEIAGQPTVVTVSGDALDRTALGRVLEPFGYVLEYAGRRTRCPVQSSISSVPNAIGRSTNLCTPARRNSSTRAMIDDSAAGWLSPAEVARQVGDAARVGDGDEAVEGPGGLEFVADNEQFGGFHAEVPGGFLVRAEVQVEGVGVGD